MRQRLADLALRISLTYGLIAVVWILLSDWAVSRVTPSGIASWLQTTKGGAFVVVTTLLLYTTLRRELQREAQEIQRREQADRALHERERQLSALFETVPVGIAILDANLQFVYTNPALSTILDRSPDELRRSGVQTLPFVNAVGEPMLVGAFPSAQAAWGNQVIQHLETGIVQVDGSTRWLSVSAVPVDVPNWHIIVIAADITERKRAELALEAERALLAHRVDERTAALSIANAELARAVRLKDEFLANMSHELRTPLNAILGRAESLQEAIYGPVTEKQVAALDGIAESGQHLLSLINDILDLAKMESGRLTLDHDVVEVELLCAMAVRMVSQSALRKRLSLTSRVDDQVQLLDADARRLKQILVNLLSNAVKFTPEGGQVGLEVQGDREEQTVTFTVWDTGIGIAAEDMTKLFQPFVQLDSRLNRQYTGTGLGLSLVARLAQAHGGSVAVESTPGQGSRFRVILPWATGLVANRVQDTTGEERTRPAVAVPAPPRGALDARGARVLLAEDNAMNRAMLTDYLQAKGYRVSAASAGREVLERVHEEPPAIILMDIQMPDMDGLTTIQQLQADPVLHTIPIIALTALAMPGDRERCLNAGARAYLTKPVNLRNLSELIQHLIAAQVGPGES